MRKVVLELCHLEVGGGGKHDVKPCIGERNIAYTDALLMHTAEGEAPKMHDCRSGLQASIVTKGGINLCSTG